MIQHEVAESLVQRCTTTLRDGSVLEEVVRARDTIHIAMVLDWSKLANEAIKATLQRASKIVRHNHTQATMRKWAHEHSPRTERNGSDECSEHGLIVWATSH